MSEAQSDAVRSPLTQYTPGPNDLLYISNIGNNSITVYDHDVAGNTAPIRVIAGSKTGIDHPRQLAEDAQGNLYVANGGTYLNGKNSTTGILVFAHAANGNVAPIRRLSGPNTKIHAVDAMTVDQTTGKIFVFDEPLPQGEGASVYLRFPPNATGNQAPYAATPIGLEPAVELASDSTGQNIIEAHVAQCCNVAGYGIGTLPKQFADATTPAALFSIIFFSPQGVADDPTTKTFLATTENTLTSAGIYRFTENTTGQFPYRDGGSTIKPAVVSIITSDTCGGQLALGYLRNIYVAHTTQQGCPFDAVYVYTHDASGNVPPLRHLHGTATLLNEPSGIYVGQ